MLVSCTSAIVNLCCDMLYLNIIDTIRSDVAHRVMTEPVSKGDQEDGRSKSKQVSMSH